jgi:hypothetical protein
VRACAMETGVLLLPIGESELFCGREGQRKAYRLSDLQIYHQHEDSYGAWLYHSIVADRVLADELIE